MKWTELYHQLQVIKEYGGIIILAIIILILVFIHVTETITKWWDTLNQTYKNLIASMIVIAGIILIIYGSSLITIE